MRIKTKFYSRKYIGNKTYEPIFLFNGEIYGKNIWVNNQGDLPQTDSDIVNFNYIYNKTYSRTSNNIFNTHFKYPLVKEGNIITYSDKIFAKLNWWKRLKLKIMMEETGWQRSPIEFGLLVVAIIGLFFNVFITLNRQRQDRQLNQEILREVRTIGLHQQTDNSAHQDQDTLVIE